MLPEKRQWVNDKISKTLLNKVISSHEELSLVFLNNIVIKSIHFIINYIRLNMIILSHFV